MKKAIKEALRLSANLWNVDQNLVKGNDCRIDAVIMAKRFFIYYLYNFVEVNHSQMKKYVHGINHSTSIYHVRQLNKQLDERYDIKHKFQILLDEMSSYSLYGAEYEIKKRELEQIKVELNKLRK